MGSVSDFEHMLAHTHNPIASWTIVCADDKHLARLNIARTSG